MDAKESKKIERKRTDNNISFGTTKDGRLEQWKQNA